MIFGRLQVVESGRSTSFRFRLACRTMSCHYRAAGCWGTRYPGWRGVPLALGYDVMPRWGGFAILRLRLCERLSEKFLTLPDLPCVTLPLEN